MKKLIELYQLLDGKKTYIVAVIVAVLNLLAAFGIISPDQITSINIILGALGLSALRAGVTKG
jgi:hypothetical protein